MSATQVTPRLTSAAQVTSQMSAAQVTLVPMNMTLNSTLAKIMSQILPVDSTLKKFDILRSKVKEAMALTSYKLRHLQNLSEELKPVLLPITGN